MTKYTQIRLLNKSNIRAETTIEWSAARAKFIPCQEVKVKTNVRKGEQGRFGKYVGQRGVVVGATVRGATQMNGRRYYVAFPRLDNKVVGLSGHYLRAVKA